MTAAASSDDGAPPGATHVPASHDMALIVLAAGAGSRFRTGGRDAGHKLLARLPATTERPEEAVVARSLAAAVTAAVGPVVVVTGAVDLHEAIAHLVDGGAALQVHHHPGWADGQMTSVHAGLAVAERLGVRRVVIGLGDQPGVRPESWRAVAADGHPVSVATYQGRRGNPVGLGRDTWALLPTGGDEGARTLIRARPDLVGEVPCDGTAADIDTVDDLDRWRAG